MSAKQGTTGVDVEAAIDALYQAPLDQFTAQRNELASALRKGGDREAADRVKALPKAGVTAWAVNQVFWRHEAAFRALLAAGEAQRSAHVAHGRGTPADVRAAAETRQRAVEVVIEHAVEALGGPASVSADARHRIAGTLEALASAGVPAGLAPGRLIADLQASGLEALSALAGLVPPPPAPPPVRPARPVLVSRRDQPSSAESRAEAKAEAAARERAQRIASAKARLAERELALKVAKAEAADAERVEKKARAAAESGTARVTELEASLEEAREAERTARRALTQAMKAASEAEMMRARTARDVVTAREQLEEIEQQR